MCQDGSLRILLPNGIDEVLQRRHCIVAPSDPHLLRVIRVELCLARKESHGLRSKIRLIKNPVRIVFLDVAIPSDASNKRL